MIDHQTTLRRSAQDRDSLLEQTREEEVRTRILIIDDDVELSGLVAAWLDQQGFQVELAPDGQAGLRSLYNFRPELVILDVGMPVIDGWEVCRRIRDLDDVPIIMLTARSEMRSRVRGFDLGADDYVTKPFEFPELHARIRAILRRVKVIRHEKPAERIITVGDLTIDLGTHQVSIAGRQTELSPTEFRLLVYLARNRGKIITHSQILQNVWGPDYRDQIAYVKLYIRYLREKIEPVPSTPRYITTERGFGYRFAN